MRGLEKLNEIGFSVSGANSVVGVSSASYLLGVNETLEIVAIKVAVFVKCSVREWVHKVLEGSRGHFKGMVTDFYLGMQCLMTYCSLTNMERKFLGKIWQKLDCKDFRDVVLNGYSLIGSHFILIKSSFYLKIIVKLLKKFIL